MVDNRIWWDAASTVFRDRVVQQSDSLYIVGGGIIVRLGVHDGITKVISCSCKHHSTKDVHIQGYCSAILSVLYYNINNIHSRLIGECGHNVPAR